MKSRSTEDYDLRDDMNPDGDHEPWRGAFGALAMRGDCEGQPGVKMGGHDVSSGDDLSFSDLFLYPDSSTLTLADSIPSFEPDLPIMYPSTSPLHHYQTPSYPEHIRLGVGSRDVDVDVTPARGPESPRTSPIPRPLLQERLGAPKRKLLSSFSTLPPQPQPTAPLPPFPFDCGIVNLDSGGAMDPSSTASTSNSKLPTWGPNPPQRHLLPGFTTPPPPLLPRLLPRPANPTTTRTEEA
jgi:hypothetical protein